MRNQISSFAAQHDGSRFKPARMSTLLCVVILSMFLAAYKATSATKPDQTNVFIAQQSGHVTAAPDTVQGDIKVGFYKVNAEDNRRQLVPRFVLNHNGHSTSAESPARLSTVQQPLLAQTRRHNTVVRVGPRLGRMTPLPEGVRLMVDGWQGEHMRCLYSSTKHVWIPCEDLVFEAPDGVSGPPPQSIVRTVNILSD